MNKFLYVSYCVTSSCITFFCKGYNYGIVMKSERHIAVRILFGIAVIFIGVTIMAGLFAEHDKINVFDVNFLRLNKSTVTFVSFFLITGTAVSMVVFEFGGIGAYKFVISVCIVLELISIYAIVLSFIEFDHLAARLGTNTCNGPCHGNALCEETCLDIQRRDANIWYMISHFLFSGLIAANIVLNTNIINAETPPPELLSAKSR
jgi:hypothetical protein